MFEIGPVVRPLLQRRNWLPAEKLRPRFIVLKERGIRPRRHVAEK